MTRGDAVAVVLFQLGGPDSLGAVEPFLYNLFCDPDIINFPGAFLGRRALAKFISSRRAKKVQEHYSQIGGRSPILELTRAQATALQATLDARLRTKVFIAMRYWHPYTAEAAQEIARGSFGRIVLLPLYPQYSKATTASSLNEWKRQAAIHRLGGIPAETICCYHNHPLYVEAIAGNIGHSLGRFGGISAADIDIVFSAHGVPLSFVRAGDPYKDQIEETVRLVTASGGWKSPHHLCYQSKVGPAEWLKPSLDATIRDLAGRGRRHILVVPIAFVTEHIETLHEINIEARREAHRLGVRQFEMMPALNDHPKFVECLAELVVANAGAEGKAAP